MIKDNKLIGGKCSICNEDGHNKRSCKEKIKKKVKLSKPKVKKVKKVKLSKKTIVFDWDILNKNPIPWIKKNKLNANNIEKLLKAADKAYHNGEAIIEDVHYDVIVDYLENLTGIKRKAIGAEVEKGATRVKLPIHMGSMDKVKPDTTKLKNWLKKYNGPYVISDKLDGISIMVHYLPNNPIPKIYTRGNGKVGYDASNLVKWMEFPKITSETQSFFRGELLISKKNWSKYKKEYKNPRNAVSGLIGGLVSGKKIRPKFLKHLHFLVFDVVTEELMTSSDQLTWAASQGFRTVDYNIYDAIDIKKLSEILLERRSESNYEIDGIIVMDNKIYPRPKSGNPKYAVAFKMVLEDQKAESTVTNVVWNISKHGLFKPIVEISPVNISGTRVQRATGYNAKWIVDNNIGPGANVIIIKSGDIIPKIIKVTKKAKPVLPPGVEGTNWEWTEGGVDAKVMGHSDDAEIKKILHFMSKMEIEGFKIGMIKKVYNAGYKTIPKILTMTQEDFLKIDGVKSKMANKLYTNMQNKYGTSTTLDLLAATNAFGEGISRKKMEPLLEKIPNICSSTLSIPKSELKSLIISMDGFSEKSANKILDNLNNCHEILKSLPPKPDITPTEKPKKELDFKIKRNVCNKVIIFSGFRNKELLNELTIRGAKFPSTVSKKVEILVTKTPDKITGKVAKANKLGIKVMSYDDFITWITTSD